MTTGPSDVAIRDTRMALVWTLATPEVFDRPPSPSGLAFLSSGPAYRAVFGSERPHLELEGIDFPWPRATGQKFWSQYLRGYSLSALPGDVAWQRLVPLRLRLGMAAGDDHPTTRVMLELFAYPFGLAIVASLWLKASLDLPALVKKLTSVRAGVSFTLPVADAASPLVGRMSDLASDLLTRSARTLLGLAATGGQVSPDPYSVVTVIAANGVEPRDDGESDPTIIRPLVALTTWSPTWTADTPPDADRAIRRKSKPKDHVVWAGDLGRVVWFPRLFGDVSEPRHTLSCYHRNQTFLALTAQSLAGLMQSTRDRVQRRDWFDLSKDDRECTKNGADMITRLYRGDDTTYRSRTAVVQLDANGGKAALNAIATTIGQTPLA